MFLYQPRLLLLVHVSHHALASDVFEPGSVPLLSLFNFSSRCIEFRSLNLQRALDQFCLILALHGDWLNLLGQIAGQEACRDALRRQGYFFFNDIMLNTPRYKCLGDFAGFRSLVKVSTYLVGNVVVVGVIKVAVILVYTAVA